MRKDHVKDWGLTRQPRQRDVLGDVVRIVTSTIIPEELTKNVTWVASAGDECTHVEPAS